MKADARVPLGRTGLIVSGIGPGSGPLGNLYHGVGDQQAPEVEGKSFCRFQEMVG